MRSSAPGLQNVRRITAARAKAPGVLVTPLNLALLCCAAFAAGLIDAIAGGGGLITVPALLSAGVPIELLFGTNKGVSVCGSSAALFRFWRAGAIDSNRAKILFPLGFLGALAGASLVARADPKLLKPLVLVLLVVAGVVVTMVRPKVSVAGRPLHRAGVKAAAIALGLGAYDGFFGPGTGTFLIIAFVTVLHLTLSAATANAKVVNFASNLASLLIFVLAGKVLWAISLPMAASNFIGGTLGAHFAIKGGDRVIRVVVLCVVVALVLKLAVDLVAVG